MSDNYFICEDDYDLDDIYAALDDGSIVPWRMDAENRAWYRRVDGANVTGVPIGTAADDLEQMQLDARAAAEVDAENYGVSDDE